LTGIEVDVNYLLPYRIVNLVAVTLISGFNPGPYTGSGNNTYLISGSEPALIDAGIGHPKHLAAVRDALAGNALTRILVTHGHPDHAAGASHLAGRWPGLRFAKMPWLDVDNQFAVPWVALADGDQISVGDGYVRVIHTPGHSPDHVCFFDEETRTLFCGDLLIKGASVVIPVSRGGSLTAYLRSLELIQALEPTRVLPAHGPEIDDLSSVVQQYVAHRQHREIEILNVLGDRPVEVDAIVVQVYSSLSGALQRMARENVLAHLVKLRDEGRVRKDDGLWSSIR
jgi:glyoxylase-like metal-dependent hydrolase (beta-lactamase superfamily II)